MNRLAGTALLLMTIVSCSGGDSSIDEGYLIEDGNERDFSNVSFTFVKPAQNSIFNEHSSASIEVQGTCSRDGVSFHLVLNNTSLVSDVCSGGQFRATVPKTSLGEGENRLGLSSEQSGNSAELFITLDTIAPVLNLGTLNRILAANASNYQASGTCSESSNVEINVGSISETATCTTTWIATLDLSSLADGANVAYEVKITDSAGNPGNAASGSVEKNTVRPAISIDSADLINAANQSQYSFSGSCSENGQTIQLGLGPISGSSTCVAGTYSSGLFDLSTLPDSLLVLSASITNAIGNQNTQTRSVTKNTSVPIVTIGAAQDINQFNQFTYSLNGACSENGRDVAIDIGGLSQTVECQSGSWSLAGINASGVTEGSVVLTADHTNSSSTSAVQASVTITKNTSSATVVILAPETISAVNQSSYRVSGECSENGTQVTVVIGSISASVNCSNQAWSAGQQDVSSLPEGPVTITADHSTATQANAQVVKSTLAPTVNVLSIATSLPDSVSLSWSANEPSGTEIEDFIVDYKPESASNWLRFNDGLSVSTSVNVTALLPGTSYQFRVAAIYDTDKISPFSNIATGPTQPSSPIFGQHRAMNVGGAVSSSVVAYEDGTEVTLNGAALVSLDKGQNHLFTSTKYDIINANKPIFTAGRRGSGSSTRTANIVWSPTMWAGKSFSLNATRNNPQNIELFAIENASVTLKQGNTILRSANITAGSDATMTWSIYGSYQLTSTGSVLAYHYSGSGSTIVDPKPLVPSALEVIGFPSKSGRLTTGSDGTVATYVYGESFSQTTTINRSDSFYLGPRGGNSSEYRNASLLITANKNISAASYADANGNCAAPFLPTNLMRTNYIINVNADWVAFASKAPGSIQVLNSSDVVIGTMTLNRSGGNSNAPYFVRRATTSAGTRFVSTVPVAGWYQPNTGTGAADQDETLLYGMNP